MNSDQKRTLDLFHRQAAKILEDKKGFTDLSLHMSVKEGEEPKSNFTKKPRENDIKAMVLDLRPIWSVGEKINFYKINNIIYKLDVITDEQKVDLAKFRDAWAKVIGDKKGYTGAGFGITINNKQFLNADTLRLWINGEYAHLDDALRDTFDEMGQTILRDFSYLIFYDLIDKMANLVLPFDKKLLSPLLERMG